MTLERPRIGWLLLVFSVLVLTVLGSMEFLHRYFDGEPPGATGKAWARLGTNTEVLVIGSSHVAYGIDPARVGPQLETLCGGALDAECTALVARRALRRATSARAVVLEVGYITLFSDSIERYGGDFRPLYALGVEPGDLPRNPWWKTRQRIVESRLFYPAFFLPRMTPHDLLLRYDAAEGAAARRAADIGAGHVSTTSVVNRATDGRVVVGFHAHDLRLERSRANTAALVRLVRELHARGLRVLLLRFPLHRTYLDARPSEWETLHEEHLTALRAALPPDRFELLDWMAAPGFNDAAFADGHHLNETGAALLTDRLRDELKARGLLQGSARR